AFSAVPNQVVAGVCTRVVLYRRDLQNNVSEEPVARTARITTIAGQSVGLHSDPGCSTQVLSVTFAAGVAGRALWVQGTSAGVIGLRAQSAG
ncbi:unnamed protein product, partial [Laminaria digitata]